jgi:hypothetical protein
VFENTDYDAGSEQHSYAKALMSVAHFLTRAGIGDSLPDLPGIGDISARFAFLAIMLSDLRRGISHPLFRPAALKTRPPDRNDIWMARAKVVTAYNLLRASGLTKSAAMRVVGKESVALQCLLERGASLSSSVRSWQRTLKKPNGRINKGIIKAVARTPLLMKEMPPASLEELGMIFLKGAVSEARLASYERPAPNAITPPSYCTRT